MLQNVEKEEKIMDDFFKKYTAEEFATEVLLEAIKKGDIATVQRVLERCGDKGLEIKVVKKQA